LILAAIPAVGVDAFKVLAAVQFDHNMCVGTQQVDFHTAPTVEWDRQLGVQAEPSRRGWQHFQAAKQKCLRRLCGH
jgi:hypothetical protein